MNPDHFSQFPITITPDDTDHANVLDIVYFRNIFYGLVSYQAMSATAPYKYSVMKTDS